MAEKPQIKLVWQKTKEYQVVLADGTISEEREYDNQLGCHWCGGCGTAPDGSECGECNGPTKCGYAEKHMKKERKERK